MQKFPKEHKLHMWHKLHKLHKLFIFQRYTIRMSSSSVVLTSFITWSWQAWSTLKRMRTPATQPLTVVSQSDGELHVHKKYEGLLPICYYDTGLRGYGPQDGYACFDRRDMLWARRLRFHIDHLRFLYCKVWYIWKNAIYVFYAFYAFNTLYSDFMQILFTFYAV